MDNCRSGKSFTLAGHVIKSLFNYNAVQTWHITCKCILRQIWFLAYKEFKIIKQCLQCLQEAWNGKIVYILKF